MIDYLNDGYRGKVISFDITNRCTNQCPACMRQHWDYKTSHIPGKDMTLEEFDDITNYFGAVDFNGSVGDPVSHPKLPEILELAHKKNIEVNISTAVSSKPIEFYRRCFNANPKARWIFGIDGTPEVSFVHRINQDGEYLFEVMKEATKIMQEEIIWQYIVFSYNEDRIEKAKQMAKEIGVVFKLNHTKRFGKQEWLKPNNDVYAEKQKEYETKFQPKCLNRQRDPFVNTQKQVLPCCWLESPYTTPDEEEFMEGHLKPLTDKSLNLKNNKIKNIVNSKIWKNFFDILTKTPDEAPNYCKERCSTSMRSFSRTTTYYKPDGTISTPDNS